MTRTFRFLLGRFWPCLAAMAVLAAAAAGSQALWLPPWTRTVFQWCFALLPKLLPSVLLFAGFFPWGRSMNLALSMGAGRRGLFGAVHLLFLVFAAAAWAVQRAVCALPAPLSPRDGGALSRPCPGRGGFSLGLFSAVPDDAASGQCMRDPVRPLLPGRVSGLFSDRRGAESLRLELLVPGAGALGGGSFLGRPPLCPQRPYGRGV